VSRSSLYRSLNKDEDEPKEKRDGEIVREVFWRHSRRYGSRRIHADLKAEGKCVGRHRIRRLMREEGLRAIQPRSFVPRTTNSGHKLGFSRNLLLEKDLPEKPNEVVVGDITYLPLQDGSFAYLATWIDLFSRKIVGWEVRDNMEEDLILKAFSRVLKRRKLEMKAIIHSDRGGQYCSNKFRALLKRKNCLQSMSRAGETYDNAFAESLFSRYKAELLEGGSFSDVEEARLETFNYIEGYYNRIRRHSSLGYLSPEEFERKYAEERDKKLVEVLDNKKRKGIKAKTLSCLNF
jgi:transposase InsO family protein